MPKVIEWTDVNKVIMAGLEFWIKREGYITLQRAVYRIMARYNCSYTPAYIRFKIFLTKHPEYKVTKRKDSYQGFTEALIERK